MARGPGTGHLIAIGIGAVLGFLSAWFDSMPIETPLIVLVERRGALAGRCLRGGKQAA